MNLWLTGGRARGRNSQGIWDAQVHIAMSKMDSQQGPTLQHMELCSVLCGSLDGKGVWGRMNTCICMAESLCCPSETITTLLIGYIPTQIKRTCCCSLPSPQWTHLCMHKLVHTYTHTHPQPQVRHQAQHLCFSPLLFIFTEWSANQPHPHHLGACGCC